MNKFFISSITALSMMTIATEASAGSYNALIEESTAPYGAIPFDKLVPSDYEDAVYEGIRRHTAELDAIANSSETPDFQNTIAALDRSGVLLSRAVLALSNIEHASGDTVMMNIMAKVTPDLSQHEASLVLNEKLWNRIKKVYENRDKLASELTPEQLRLLDETYLSFAQSGATLEGADREKFRKLNAELSDLNVRFAQNVSNEMKNPMRRLWVRGSDLAGIPESIRHAAREEAKEILIAEGKADDEDLYVFTMFSPSYGPFMKYADNRELREKMYRMYSSRNNGGEFDNMQVLKDIANVRLEIAKLMGKENFAEYQLQRTMAKNTSGVMNLLDQLKDAYTAPMRMEIAEIEKFAKEQTGEDITLRPWDYSYWADKLKNARYSFSDEDMKPYFELNNTIDGVFGLATKLYGYKFKENKDIPVYHPDVKAFEVYEKDGSLLGLLYADFFYRPGKAPGAWMTDFRTETKDDEGNRNIPFISIVCNFSKPVGNNPVLLTPMEVETFLHEFGHALHGLSAQATYNSLSGTNVYHDFVELFSQFNENYLTEKEFLDGFARHYKTGKKMPAKLLENFVKASQFGAAYACMRQLNFGYLDMAYHTITEPLRASMNVGEFESKAIEPARIFDAEENCIISPAFAHIFSGGYAAGYYGYKWAEELDADAFAAFKENGIFNKKTAEKFKHMLQMGGTVDPMELYIEFRGKKPTVDALMIRDGIKAPAKGK